MQLLGKPPWSLQDIKILFFKCPSEAEHILKIHPGYNAASDISILEKSLSVFLLSCDKLLESVRIYTEKRYNMGADIDFFSKKLEEIALFVFSATSSAISLVDHSRRIAKRHKIDEYKDVVDSTFSNNPHHILIKDLRNFMIHYIPSDISWQTVYKIENPVVTNFYLKKSYLNMWGGWSQKSKLLIDKSETGIDVADLFIKYKEVVIKFNSCLQRKIAKKSWQDLIDYRKYERYMDCLSLKSLYSLLITIASNNNIDPYSHLTKHLSDDEIELITIFPKGSREQIDRIIDLADDYGAIDEEMRQIIYKHFSKFS